MNGPLIARLVREQRVRLPLEILLIGAWGFLLVAVFATSDVFTKQLEAQAKQFGGLLDLIGLDPLAQWASIGFQHPIFLLGGGLFAVGIGIRAIAGELEAGSLALALSRPIARRTWFLSHLLVLVVGCLIISEAYALGCLLATAFTSPMGHLEASWMLLAGAQGGLLLLALGGIAFVISAFSSERGRALSWTVGIIVILYAGNFLLPLWGPTKELAKISPFGWFNPAPLLQRGDVAWGDWVVLALYAAIPLAVAAWQFARRDLAGG
jgi:ABC-type transport system involved in multi-copper enzyme maturation permease subunit